MIPTEGTIIVRKNAVRFISALLLMSMCLGLLAGCGSRGDNAGDTPTPDNGTQDKYTGFTDRTIRSEADARAAVGDVAGDIGIADVENDLGEAYAYTALDSSFYRFGQVYKGIPVYGRSVVVGASAEGDAESFSHNYLPITDIEVALNVWEDEAKQIAEDAFDGDVCATSCTATVYSLFDHKPVLAWQIQVVGPGQQYTCFVDSNTGEYIAGFSEILTQTAVGTYKDSKNEISFNTVENGDGTYSMIDESRNIEVYDANYQTMVHAVVDDAGNAYRYDKEQKEWFDANGNQVLIPGDAIDYGHWDVFDTDGNIIGRNAAYQPCTGEPLQVLQILTNPTTRWKNQKAATAMSLTASAYDFYKTVFERAGFNGKNGLTRITVNDHMKGDTNNAYSAGGKSRVYTLLSFGHSITITADLVGHEFTHSVEQSISNMVYAGESGAIMEALSDVFGELFEDWLEDGELDGGCDWVLLERNMIEPAKSEPAHPAYYLGKNYYFGTKDNGGVHKNSTVISHAAYLMTHPKEPGLKALTNEELANVLFHAISSLPSDCTFSQFAYYVCKSAAVLKLSEKKQDCIVEAFESVGIVAERVLIVPITNGNLDYQVTETSQWYVYGKDGKLCDNYTLLISGKENKRDPFTEPDTTVTEYKVQSKEPLTLELEPGCMYDFTLVDGTDPEKTRKFRVGVNLGGGLVELVDIHTDFGKELGLADNGMLFLTERPAGREELFDVNSYTFYGYVYESERGYYGITTLYPSDLDTIVSRSGDFHHTGDTQTITVQWKKSESNQVTGLGLFYKTANANIRQTINAADIHDDRETFYYLIDGPSNTYLVCESITYDNASVEPGFYRYKTTLDREMLITESIAITNLKNGETRTFSVEYVKSLETVNYWEEFDSFDTWDYNSLYNEHFLEPGMFDNRADAVAYIKTQLAQYGLEDRVCSEKSALTDYIPLLMTTVNGVPRSVNITTMEDTALQAYVTIGSPKQNGSGNTDPDAEEPVTPPAGGDAGAYGAFLANREYMSDWMGTGLSDYYTLSSYSLVDIDQNGTDELIIYGSGYDGFEGFLVFAQDPTTGRIVRVRVDPDIRDIASCFGGVAYSPKYKALVLSETRSTAGYGAEEYFVLEGGQLRSIGVVGHDVYLGEGTLAYYTTLGGSLEIISEEERYAYSSERESLDASPLT